MKPPVDARIVVPHEHLCDGDWIFATRYQGDDEIIEMVLCDSLGRRRNGGIIYWVLRCNRSWACHGLAHVRKGLLRGAAVDAIEALP